MLNINHKVKDTVYWLSSTGFKKGIITSITYRAFLDVTKKTNIENLTYTVWCKDFPKYNIGETVESDKIFKTKSQLIDYYQSKLK